MLDQHAVRTLQIVLTYARSLSDLELLTAEDDIAYQSQSTRCCGDPGDPIVDAHDLVSQHDPVSQQPTVDAHDLVSQP